MQSKQGATEIAKDGMLCQVDMLSIKSRKGFQSTRTEVSTRGRGTWVIFCYGAERADVS